ncbi:MAG: GGDEF domain-containing protein, partial [Spirochaetes bacterium]|nr:GGDEF domain-containing protein [Spirochaetota bacterium]
IFSIIIFSANLIFNEKGKLHLAFHLAIFEITIHAALATICIGWESNFCFYSVAICSVIMFSTFLKMKIKIIDVALSTILYLFAFAYVVIYPPLYNVDKFIIGAMGLSNILIIIPLLTTIFYSFYNATEILNQRLKNASEIDGLTGVYNRRFFNEYSEIEIKRIINERNYAKNMNYTSNFALAIIDLDDFKKINDTYGHITGDNVLIQTVNIIKKIIFTRDIVCRYGGEEFVVLFTKTSKEGAIQAIEKIRKEVERSEFIFNDDVKEGHVTLSIGFASFDDSNFNNINDILKLADDRLYAAKSGGKNKLICN